jgi:hypothetical protein
LVSHLYGIEKGTGDPRRRITPMNPTDQFLKHAAECQQMAKATRNAASKATWNRMAERWLQCAERAESQSVAQHARMPLRGCPAFLLNIEKRSLPRLMLSGDGLASNDAV